MSEKIVEIKDVAVNYGDVLAIRDVSFDVHAGEFFGLIGVNGAGKTSLIKTMLGLRDPDEGQVTVMGQAINQNKTSDNIAFLPERFEPSWFLTGIEFLKFSTKIYGASWADKDFIAQAERLSLNPDALKRRVQTYSKGMRQKLGLLSTIMTKSEILILDEPMSGLDPVARTLVKDLLVEERKAGRTILISSHILADMDEICDRIAIIDQQSLKFIGTPSALKDQANAPNLERAFLHFVEQAHAA